MEDHLGVKLNLFSNFKKNNLFFFVGNYETADVVEIPLIDNIHPRRDFMPMAIPEDLSERLIRLHGNPFVWFTGQLIKYFLRPQPWLRELMEQKYQAINFQTPIVG
jgi:glycoprotein 6-alpha-L-fucosyltransferase